MDEGRRQVRRSILGGVIFVAVLFFLAVNWLDGGGVEDLADITANMGDTEAAR